MSNRVTGAPAIASTACVRAASSACQTSRDGCAKRAQTLTALAVIRFSRWKSVSLSTATLATSPPCSAGNTLGGNRLFAPTSQLFPYAAS